MPLKRRTTIPKRLPEPLGQTVAEREYYRLLRKYSQAYEAAVSNGLKMILAPLRKEAARETPPEGRHDSAQVRLDANAEQELRELFEAVQSQLERLFPDTILAAWSRAMVGHVNRVSKGNIARTAKTVDIDIEPLLHDRGLNPYFQNVVDENVGLIRSIAQSDVPQFKNQLVMAITQDLPSDQIRQMIQDHFGKSREKARLLAVDQVGKLNGRLDQYRQQQVGGSRYRWRTSKDERVAGNPSGRYPHATPSHWAREGKTYRWDSPPKGGHPKQRVRCRCWAEMVIEDIVE